MADDSSYGYGNSPFSDFMNYDPGNYGGPNFNYQGNYKDDMNSPLYGGPGWIHPSGAGDLQSGDKQLGTSFFDTPDSGSSPQTANRGYNYSYPGADNTSPTSPQPNFNPRGTSYQPARSSNFSGPSLAAPNLGTPDHAIYDRLKSVLGDPSQVANDPLYKFLQEQGMEGFNRSAAARGMRLSGNTMLGAQDYNQGLAQKYFQSLVGSTLIPGANTELQRWLGPAQTEVSRYGASRFGSGSTVGAQPGTAGEYAAQDMMPYITQILGRMGSGSNMNPAALMPYLMGAGGGMPGLGGQSYEPRLASGLGTSSQDEEIA